jgi:hypothetical protein
MWPVLGSEENIEVALGMSFLIFSLGSGRFLGSVLALLVNGFGALYLKAAGPLEAFSFLPPYKIAPGLKRSGMSSGSKPRGLG